MGAAPVAVEAQRAAKPRRMGYLSSNSASLTQRLVDASGKDCASSGMSMAQNIRIEYRFAPTRSR